jgi:predicted DNA-binding transcriptional regulator AlpA
MSVAERYKLASEIALLVVSAMRSPGLSSESALRLAAQNAPAGLAGKHGLAGVPTRNEHGGAIEKTVAQTGFCGFYSRHDIKKLTTWSDATLWRRIKEGAFPAPLQISRNRVGWLRADVEAWLLRLRRTDGVPIAGGIVDTLPAPNPNPRRRGRVRVEPTELIEPTPVAEEAHDP